MSYPINQAITYTAVAATQGQPGDAFTYAWAFDDNTTANTASAPKTWTTTGPHFATVTATDTVTGGSGQATKLITIDPFAWVARAAKPSIANGRLSVVLNDGDVFWIDQSNSNCYRYNVAGNLWSSTTNMGVSVAGGVRYDQTFVLPSGKVIQSGLGSNQLQTRIFNPVGDTWSDGPAMHGYSNGEVNYAAIKLTDGRIFNYSYGNPYTVQIYDESLGTWALLASPLAKAPNFIGRVLMVQLDSDRIYVSGFWGGDNNCYAQIYSLSGNSWSNATPPPAPQLYYALTTPDLVKGNDGYIYMIGWAGDSSVNRHSAKYSISNGIWTSLRGYTSSSSSSSASPANRILVAGGSKILIVDYNYSIVYDIASDTYSSPITDYCDSTSMYAGCVILRDGRPFVLSGTTINCQVFSGTY
jgi:hypothetical protein